MTATTLRVQWTGLTGRGRCGGDAQERVATNPVAALPCARPPLLTPLSTPCLPLVYPLSTPCLPLVYPLSTPCLPLAYPPAYPPISDRGGVLSRGEAVWAGGGDDPGRSRAKTARDRRTASSQPVHSGSSSAGRRSALTSPLGQMEASPRNGECPRTPSLGPAQ